jgi:pimeloyl-ACP methyl ester carboxylesterase
MELPSNSPVTALPPPERVGIRIRMDREFQRFGQKEQAAFVAAFQELLAISDTDLVNVSFRKGCVNFEAEIPLPVWRKLKAMAESLDENPDAEELKPLRDFLEQFDVKGMSEQIMYSFSVRASDKTKPDTRDHVVFIHGWSGSAESFGNLPRFIESRLACKAIVYTYPTRRLAGSPAVSFLAQNLDNWIRQNAPAAPKLAFVAHSMGGILVRKFIADQNRPYQEDPLDTRVKQITLVASPYDGAVLARLAAHFSSNEQLRDIDPNSPMILDLNRDWEHWVRSNVPANCKVRCIVSTDDEIVSVNNARGFDPNPIVLLGKSHSDIVKPQSVSDEIVVTIAALLKEGGIGRDTIAAKSA